MVTIEELLPYSYWIGHPVSNRAIVYSFVGFVPLNKTNYYTLCYIIKLNTVKWELRFRHRRPALTKLG